jgi:type IV pilus assembly protein PilE
MIQNKGFTLIEVMVVVVIIGVIASIAYPSYVGFITRGARGDAVAGVMQVANLQEQFYLDHRAFTADMNLLGLGADPFKVENKLYEVDAVLANGGYTVTATAIGVQATRDTECKTISITSAGAKTPSGCW